MASTTPNVELYTNYRNIEATISSPTTYAIATLLGRNANFLRIKVDVAVTVSLNGGDAITIDANDPMEFTDKVAQTLLVTPAGSTAVKIYFD